MSTDKYHFNGYFFAGGKCLSERDLFELWLAKKPKSGSSIHSFSDHFIQTLLSEKLENFSPQMLYKNEHGKPLIKNSSYCFNLSNCDDDYALLICKHIACGVDIQKVENLNKYTEALKSVLTDREWRLLVDQGKESDFFQLWSVKEALIKAMGSSIWFGRDYEIEVKPGEYSDLWFQSNGYYIYSTEIIKGKFLSIAALEKPDQLVFRKFK